MLLNDNKIAFCHSRNIISIVDPFNDYYYSIIIGKSVYRSFFQLNDLGLNLQISIYYNQYR